MGGAKDQIMSFFKTNPAKGYNKTKRAKYVYARGNKPNNLNIKKPSEQDDIIKNITNLFKLKKESEAIKDRIE